MGQGVSLDPGVALAYKAFQLERPVERHTIETPRMIHSNPLYDPNWEQFHNEHAAERERLAEERNRLIAAGNMSSDAYRHVAAEHDRHHEACLAAFRMQHPTVQDYAAWLFGTFDVSMEDHGAGIPVPQVDLATLRTIEEVDQAWSRIHRAVSDSAHDKQNSLPAGQPAGLSAFSDAIAPGLSRYWREFQPSELYPQGSAGTGGVWTLMTVDEQPDGWHVCFMHDWKQVDTSVTNAIEALANAVYREACALAGQPTRPTLGLRAWLLHWRMAARPKIDPARFHFYQHIPPRGLSIRESFSRIDLPFKNGRYSGPEWFFYEVVPTAIQSARFDCALNGSPLPARLRIASKGHV